MISNWLQMLRTGEKPRAGPQTIQPGVDGLSVIRQIVRTSPLRVFLTDEKGRVP